MLVKAHPWIRKTVKWGGAAATVLLVVVWIGSAWWAVTWESREFKEFRICAGRISLADYRSLRVRSTGQGWEASPIRYRFLWTSEMRSLQGAWEVVVPLWMLTLPSLIVTVAAGRLDTLARRRARLNLCPTRGCNYDRTGLAAGAVCPECGKLPA